MRWLSSGRKVRTVSLITPCELLSAPALTRFM